MRDLRGRSAPARVLLLLACACYCAGWSATGPLAPSTSARRAHAPLVMLAKARASGGGFGKPPPPPPPKKRAPSEGQTQREKAASDFDQLKSSGAPEYVVSIREVKADGSRTAWSPVGGIAVPRSGSEDLAVSMAIFQNEGELLKGAFRNYPRLKASTDKFEYGYRLKEFPDDPVKIVSEEKTKQPTNPIMQWFNTLDNPLNRE